MGLEIKSILIKYDAFIVALILFFSGFLIYLKANQDLDLEYISFTDYQAHRVVCSDREKAGKRYLRIKSNEMSALSSLGRIKNCKNYESAPYKNLDVKYRSANNVIYGLVFDGKEVISVQESKERGSFGLIMLYLIFCIMVGGIFLGYKRQFAKRVME